MGNTFRYLAIAIAVATIGIVLFSCSRATDIKFRTPTLKIERAQ